MKPQAPTAAPAEKGKPRFGLPGSIFLSAAWGGVIACHPD